MNTQVAKNTVVTLDYNVTDPDGELVDAGKEPLVYLHGGYDDIFPKIEEAVQGKKIGESIVVKLLPDEAFGEYDDSLIQVEPADAFPKEIQVGMSRERRRAPKTRISSSPRDRHRRRQGCARRQTIRWPACR